LRFANVPLEKVLLAFASVYHLPITFEADIRPEERNLQMSITQSNRHVTLATALCDVLNEADLTCHLHDQQLVIDTRERAAKRLEWRTYAVADLVRSGISLQQSTRLIRGVVFSELDLEADDEDGTVIVPTGTALVVHHNAAAQQEIAEVIAALRSRSPRGVQGADALMEHVLSRRVTVRFEAVPFEQAIDQLRELLQVPIALDYRALENGKFSLEQPVTLDVVDMTVESLMDQLCNWNWSRLAVMVQNGEFVITPAYMETDRTRIRVYDVRGLNQARSLDPRQLPRLVAQLTGGEVDWDDRDAGLDDNSPSRIQVVGGLMFVRRSQHVEREIENLLRMVRRAGAFDPATIPLTSREAREEALRIRLESPCWLTSETMTLRSLPAWLGERLGLPARIDQRLLEDATNHWDDRIEVEFDGLPVYEAFARALQEGLLTLIIDHEMVVLTSFENAEEHRDVRIYSASRSSGHKINDFDLENLAWEAMLQTSRQEDEEAEIDPTMASIVSVSGLLCVRTKLATQRAVARQLGLSEGSFHGGAGLLIDRFEHSWDQAEEPPRERSRRSQINP
jgi:hypothetical protein